MDTFAAIADPVRRDLLRVLAAHPARVVDLTAGRTISRPAVSKHLRVLAQAGLVVADDVGRERHYRLRREGLRAVAGLLDELTRPALLPPVTEDLVDALGLEVRRVGRDRSAEQEHPNATTPAPHQRTGETA